ncbi:MAG: hypothetical protein ACYDIC_06580 [Desulfobaccales bacterium]
MNKKAILVLALVVALALPTAAMAAAEFSLGGFIKLDAFWDSTQEGKNMNTLVFRNNDPTNQHGRLKFTSQGSRFNFTIKGPKLWGATTTGFIEMDFDSQEEGLGAATGGRGIASGGASNAYTPRLRSAFFRFNWPETELLFGQYFTFMSQWFPELLQDGPFMLTGTPTARMPMIKLTQKFAGSWQVGAMVGEANGITNFQTYNANIDHTGGESTEAPQVQGQVQFQQDLYGKAAWYGNPMPFTAQVTGAWQRGITQDAARALSATGQDAFTAVAGFTRHQYHDPWALMGVLFVPVIPTHSANLAGTASLQTSWWVGQGVEVFGWTGFGSQVFRWDGTNVAGQNFYDVNLMSRFGGQIQGQYYFTNQWFLTGAWGMSKAFGVGAFQTNAFAPGNRQNILGGDAAKGHNEFDLALWYRPIQAFKFGLQYAYNRTDYFQNLRSGTAATPSNVTNLGEAHRIEFVGLFFF